MGDSPTHMENKSGKSRKLRGRTIFSVPLVHVKSQSSVSIISKSTSGNFRRSTDSETDSDFPALPSYPVNTSNSPRLDFNQCDSFSKVLSKKPEPSSFKFNPRVSCESVETHVPVARTNHCGSQLHDVTDTLVVENVKNTATNKKKDTTSVQKNVLDRTTCNNENISTGAQNSTNVKKKKKKKSKKSEVKQGKVNTISQEQYLAIKESQGETSVVSVFNTSIEDEREYPALGVQVKDKTAKLKKNPGASINDNCTSPSEKKESTVSASASPTLNKGSPQLGIQLTPKKENCSSEKKFKSPIQMNIADMLYNMKTKPCKKSLKFEPPSVKREKLKPSSGGPLNLLDSSRPTRKRGKERELPKKPKLSKLKKVILKERMEKRMKIGIWSMQTEQQERTDDNRSIQSLEEELNCLNLESDKSDESVPLAVEQEVSTSNEDIESSSPNQDNKEEEEKLKCAKKLLHYSKFREYCNHFISEEIEELTKKLLTELVRYQDRLFLKDPVKARARRRLICGLREVTKNLKLRKLKLVIVAPDVEEINSQGGLNDALHTIVDFCESYNTPLIFSLPKRNLGRVCMKKVPLSCVGIFNYEGTEDIYKQLMELVEEAKQVYKETEAFAITFLCPEMIEILRDDGTDHVQVDALRTAFWASQNII